MHTNPEHPMFSALVLLSTANAYIYSGNPELSFTADLPLDTITDSSGHLEKIRLIPCTPGAPTVVTVGEDVEPHAGVTVDIPSGDWCTAELHWDGPSYLDGSGFSVEVNDTVTQVDVSSGNANTVPFVPYTVESGYIYSGNPELTLAID